MYLISYLIFLEMSFTQRSSKRPTAWGLIKAIKLSLELLGLVYLYSVQTRYSFLAVWTMIMSSQQYRRVNMSESPIISRKVTLRTSYSKRETNLLLIVFKWTYICLSKWNIHSTLSEKRIVYHCPRLIKLSLRASKYYK